MEEIEQAGCIPKLVHAAKAKLMLGMVNKTDKLDARGLNKLQRTGTLPIVWIPPGELRDKRELTRARMVLVRQRTRLKQRIHAPLSKYGLLVKEVSDPFGVEGRRLLTWKIAELPPETGAVTEMMLEQVEVLDQRIATLERRMEEVLAPSKEVKLLMGLPGGGVNSGHGDCSGGWGCAAVPWSRASCFLCGDGPQNPTERWLRSATGRPVRT
ncbi:transposase [Candidatus Bipolaricaulota bacterium]|nr:transposase [Candidatus Bipolaricaulota bacterium]